MNQKTKKSFSKSRRLIIENSKSRITLRPIRISDVTKEYVKWLNSKKINQYLESRFVHHTSNNVKKFIENTLTDKNVYFFAIICKEDGKHIGNIKLGPINIIHKIGEIGILIGNQNSWGQGYATEAIDLLSYFAQNKLKLHKIIAHSYENNIGSVKAFLKAGFVKEGIRKKHLRFKNNYVSLILLGKILR